MVVVWCRLKSLCTVRLSISSTLESDITLCTKHSAVASSSSWRIVTSLAPFYFSTAYLNHKRGLFAGDYQTCRGDTMFTSGYSLGSNQVSCPPQIRTQGFIYIILKCSQCVSYPLLSSLQIFEMGGRVVALPMLSVVNSASILQQS